MARFVFSLLVLLLVACAQTPGQQVGEFDVTQALVENSCGASALPAPDPLVFRAELREDERSVYWRYETRDRFITGSDINGTLNFSLQTSMEQPIELSDGSMVTCRLNQIESLELLADEDIKILTGNNQIRLAGANAECAYLTQGRGGPFLALPCQVSYEVEAYRIEDEAAADGEDGFSAEADAASGQTDAAMP